MPATLIDPSTGRPAFTGPNGEAGLAANDPRVKTMAGLVPFFMPDGRLAYIIPGKNISASNRLALTNYTSGQQGPSAADVSAQNRVSAASAAVLRDWGLDELSPDLDALIRSGGSWEEFQLQFFDPTSRPAQVVNRLFPEWKARRDAGNPVSIGQIVGYRAQAKQLLRSAGLPEGFYDQPEDFTSFITNDISLDELQTRIQDGFVAASQAAPEVRAQLKNYYGVDDAGIAAYFLDPSRALPVLKRQIATAKIGGAGSRVGLTVDRQSAERLAGLGVDESTAGQLYAKVAQDVPLLRTLQARFNDPEDPLTSDHYAEALVINDPQTLLHAARLVAQEHSQYSGSGLFGADQTGAQRGLLSR